MWGLMLRRWLHLKLLMLLLLHLGLALFHHHRCGHATLAALWQFQWLLALLNSGIALLGQLARWKAARGFLHRRCRHGLALQAWLIAVGHATVDCPGVALRTPTGRRLALWRWLRLLHLVRLLPLGPLARRLLLRTLRRHHGGRHLDAMHGVGTWVAAWMAALATFVVSARGSARTWHVAHLAWRRHHAGRQLHALRRGRRHGADGGATVATPAALHHFVGCALRRHRHRLALLQRLGRHHRDATGHTTVGVRHRRTLATFRLTRQQRMVAVDALDVVWRSAVGGVIGLARCQRNPTHPGTAAHTQ